MEIALVCLLLFVVLLLAKINSDRLAFDARANEEARRRHDQWKESEMKQAVSREVEMAIVAIRESAKNEILLHKEQARLDLEKWKTNETLRIRQDATKRSAATHIGKVTEHLVPWFLDGMFDPRDIRFIGSPIDMVVFDGLAGGYIDAIHFIEVKSGKSPRLSPREDLVRGAVTRGRVGYEVLHLSGGEDGGSPVTNWLVKNIPSTEAMRMNAELDQWFKQRSEALSDLEFEKISEIDRRLMEGICKRILAVEDQVAILQIEIDRLRSKSKK